MTFDEFAGRRKLPPTKACDNRHRIAFGLARLAGDPVPLLMPAEAKQADLDFFREQLGLDRPLPEQFLRFLGHIVRGDFGDSFRYDQPALELIGLNVNNRREWGSRNAFPLS